MLNKKINVEEIIEFLKTCDKNTRLYIGCDSNRCKVKGKWMADYTSVCVVHRNGNNGCRIFGEVVREFDYDQRKDRPRMRLNREVQLACELYGRLGQLVEKYDVEIHIDINPNPKYGSSIALNDAIGYVKAMTGKKAITKNDAWAATFGADRLKGLYDNGLIKKD